jgi:hypothetical protein
MKRLDRLKNKIASTYANAIKKEFIQQGHNLTGKAAKSIEYETKDKAEGFEITVSMLYYGNIVDKGIKPERIPFGKPRAAKSKYIEGLKKYVQKRMKITGKKALSIAFAIAKVQKKEGMSTRKSRRFSKTKQRQNFVDAAVENVDKKIDSIIRKETNLLLKQIIQL